MVLLKLIRWPNLLMIVFLQYLIRFAIIEELEIPHVLDHLHFFYGVLCSISLAAAGYIINDLHDLETDKINKPHRLVIGSKISETAAKQLYLGLNLLAIVTGYLISKASGMPNLWMLPLVAIGILYFYAISLKKIPIVGNLVVSFLTALPVILVAFFDLVPAITNDNQAQIKGAIYIIAAYSLFAFWTNFIREIVKDAEDYDGDKKQGYSTLAVILGREQIRYVILFLSIVLLSFTSFYNYYLFENDPSKGNWISAFYTLLSINIPILLFMFSIIKAKSTQQFKLSSKLIKLIMLTGILSLLIFTIAFTIDNP